MAENNKGSKELFVQFFENPTRETLRDLLRDHVGETDKCDFKETWPPMPKVAKHILGFANSGGGCLVIGVREMGDGSFDQSGIKVLMDKAKITQGVQKFVPKQVKFSVFDFSYDESKYPKLIGKKFQTLIVEDQPQYIPFISEEEGEGIRKNAIYVRHGTSTEETSYEELQAIINRRIETKYSSTDELDLRHHLIELQILYEQVPYLYPPQGQILSAALVVSREFNKGNTDYEKFVDHLIFEKKRLINKLVTGKNSLLGELYNVYKE